MVPSATGENSALVFAQDSPRLDNSHQEFAYLVGEVSGEALCVLVDEREVGWVAHLAPQVVFTLTPLHLPLLGACILALFKVDLLGIDMILAHLCLDSRVNIVHSVEVDKLYRAVDVLSALGHQVSEGVVLGVVLIRNRVSRERNDENSDTVSKISSSTPGLFWRFSVSAM